MTTIEEKEGGAGHGDGGDRARLAAAAGGRPSSDGGGAVLVWRWLGEEERGPIGENRLSSEY